LNGRLCHVQEADELLMPMTLHAPPDHRAIQHVRALT
jgi:hypothetical protein